ncbi:MAG: NAD(P)-dependent oxidoreductase [Solobacterium sp.]|nr:NAD(P)-dependent oxidoreductase [Solobacterium sp.]
MKYTQQYWEDADKALLSIPDPEKLFHKTILITGGTGMICSAVTEILVRLNERFDAGINILIAVRTEEEIETRFPGFLADKKLSFVKYDATKPEALDIHADYIIHAASNAHPAAYTAEPVETILGNVLGLNTLLSMAVRNGVQRLLYFSSSEIYGEKKEARPYVENDFGYVDILNPRACYPSSKRAAETLCVAYGQEYAIDTVIVRPGHIYGPTIGAWDTRASAQFSRDAAEGRNIVMKSAGAQLRSYCYTMDCASAILTVLLEGENGNAYNISNPQSICTIREIAEALAEAGGTEVVFENPSDLEKKGYNMMSNSALDSKKLESLGWKPAFDLKAGAERTVRYLKNN